MKKIHLLFRALMLCSLAFVLVACGSSRKIDNPHVSIHVVPTLTQEEVRTAILNTCAQRNWVARDVGPEAIEAVLRIRVHTAIITINYTATEYHMLYKSSINLEAKNGRIHTYYNSWVENLRRHIDAELASMALAKQQAQL